MDKEYVLEIGGDISSLVDSEFIEYDAEKKKSSDVKVHPLEGILEKKKDRSFNGTVYECFVSHWWHRMLTHYEKQKSHIKTPLCKGFKYSRFEGKTFFEYICGINSNNIPTKKDQKIVLELRSDNSNEVVDSKVIRAGSLIASLAGTLNKIKESENILHGDYSLRHMIIGFSKFKDMEDLYDFDMYIVDLENSRKGTLSEVKKENDNLCEQLFRRFNTKEAQKMYEQGYDRIEGMNIFDKAYKDTLRLFKEKSDKPIDFDIYEGKVLFPKE